MNEQRKTDGLPPTVTAGLERVMGRLKAAPVSAAALEREQADEISRQREKALAAIAADLGVRYSPQRCSFETFKVYHSAQNAALKRLQVVADVLVARKVEDVPNVVLFGSVGTGKDHLLSALLHFAAYHGLPCRWRNGKDLFGQLRDRMDVGLAEEKLIQELADPAVLALSDPVASTDNANPWRLEFLYRLVERRYRMMRPTWMTLNATSPADAEAKLSSPVWDRLQESAELIPCFWPSFRERK